MICRKYWSVFGLVATLFCQELAMGAEGVTPPVGVYRFLAMNGANLIVPGLLASEKFQGRASSVTGGFSDSVLTVTGAGWVDGEFDEAAPFPTHYLEIVEPGHLAQGLVIDVIRNMGDNLILAIGEEEVEAWGIEGGVRVSLREHVTLERLFANTSIASFSDEVKLLRPEGTLRYIHNGNQWVNAANLVEGGNEVIYPGEGLSFRTSAAEKDILVGGSDVAYVKTGPTRITSYGGGLNAYVGAMNPLIGGSGQVGDIDFGAYLTAPFSDAVRVLGNAGDGSGLVTTARYIYNGTELVDSSTLQSVATEPLAYGQAFVLRTSQPLTVLIPSGM